MSTLKERLEAYNATIVRAANIIDLTQKTGAGLTAAQMEFVATMLELTRLGMLGAPDSVLLAALDDAYAQAQAVIAELAE